MKNIFNNLALWLPFNPSRISRYFRLRLKYLTFKKLINLLKTEYAFYRKRHSLNSSPYELIIEPTNICQLRCPFCYAGKIKYNQEKGFMDYQFYKEIIDELGQNALHVFLHLRGESLLHKDICEFIKYAHNANLGTSISTNLSMPFDEKQIEAIIDSGLDTLVISADGITPEVYSEYRIGGDFERVVANIKMLVEKRKAKKRKTPYLEWQFLVMKQNEHQLKNAKKFIKELGVDSIVFGGINIPCEEIKVEVLEKWQPKNIIYKNEQFPDKPDNLLKNCWWLWRSVIIQWDGMVFPCCYLHGKKDKFAAFEKPFDQIWNNSNYVSARNLFSNNRSKSAVKTICHTCTVTKGLRNVQ